MTRLLGEPESMSYQGNVPVPSRDSERVSTSLPLPWEMSVLGAHSCLQAPRLVG